MKTTLNGSSAVSSGLNSATRPGIGLRILRIPARVLSLPIILAFGFEMVEGLVSGHAFSLSAIPMGIVFLAILGGMILAWWRELPGGLVSLAGMIAMTLYFRLMKGMFPPPGALVFTLPVWLFLLSGWLNRSADRHSKAPCLPNGPGI